MPEVIIGGTANSYEEATRVWATDIDYIGVGPVFPTSTKNFAANELAGLDYVAQVAEQSVPIYREGIGTVQALNTVTVRAQVDGRLTSVDFTEGQTGLSLISL